MQLPTSVLASWDRQNSQLATPFWVLLLSLRFVICSQAAKELRLVPKVVLTVMEHILLTGLLLIVRTAQPYLASDGLQQTGRNCNEAQTDSTSAAGVHLNAI